VAGDKVRARELIDAGADLTVRDPERGATALHECEDPELCSILLEAGAAVDGLSDKGLSPLYWAAARPDGAAKIRVLLDAGADPRLAADDGQTALHNVATTGQLEAAPMLLAAGAEVDAETSAGTYPGTTPLLCAAEAGRKDMIALLLEHGANLEAADHGEWQECGRTALHFAVEREDLGLIEWLLEKGADPEAARSDGYTTLDVAEDNDEILEILDQY
jgi:ankyrin repeat protein